MDQPPAEHLAVQLWIELPSGPLMANATISRRVTGGRAPGCGVQFFALSSSSKSRWDDYIYNLSEKRDFEAPGALPSGAAFLIRFPSLHRMNLFYEDNINRGGFYLATPVIREPGAVIGLVLIHPVTEAEFTTSGTVLRVKADVPRGMEIKLNPMEPPEQERLKQFIATGVLTKKPAPMRPQRERTDSISLDIEIDETSISRETLFEWDEVSESEMVIDVDVTTADLEEEVTKEFAVDVAEPEMPTLASQAPKGEMVVQVTCESCKFDCGKVDLGAPPGTLGLLAVRKPYWSVKLDHLVSVLRLKPASERDAVFSSLDAASRVKPVSLAFAFDIAALTAPPRCPSTGGIVRLNRVAKKLTTLTSELEQPNAKAQLEGVRCPDCDERSLVAERIKPSS